MALGLTILLFIHNYVFILELFHILCLFCMSIFPYQLIYSETILYSTIIHYSEGVWDWGYNYNEVPETWYGGLLVAGGDSENCAAIIGASGIYDYPCSWVGSMSFVCESKLFVLLELEVVEVIV